MWWFRGSLEEQGLEVGWATAVRRRSAICGIHSRLYPVMVAWHTGPEEGSQEEMGSPDHPSVSAVVPVWELQIKVRTGIFCPVSHPSCV